MKHDSPTVVTFDCYGTLVDWEKGLTDAFGVGEAEREGFLAKYVAAEAEVESGPWRPYREVLAETARRLLDGRGSGDSLPRSVANWPLFPDTRAALAHLVEGGIRIGVLSNVDDDLFRATAAKLAVPVDPLVTAEQVRSYKPRRAHFDEARRRLGGDSARWLHAAQSLYHDVRPARALAIPVAWVNRTGESAAEEAPFPTLLDLADHLVPREGYRVSAVASSDIPDVIRLVSETLSEFGIRFGEGCDTDAELERLPDSYEGRGGRFFIARDPAAGTLLGTCGILPVAPGDFELRKMYVASAGRGRGLGKALLLRALAVARGRGARRVVLDTTEEMTRAQAFYEANGFVRDDARVRSARCTRGYALTF